MTVKKEEKLSCPRKWAYLLAVQYKAVSLETIQTPAATTTINMTRYAEKCNSGTLRWVATNSCLIEQKTHYTEGNNAWHWKPSQLSGATEVMDFKWRFYYYHLAGPPSFLIAFKNLYLDPKEKHSYHSSSKKLLITENRAHHRKP